MHFGKLSIAFVLAIAPTASAIDLTEFPVSQDDIVNTRFILSVIKHPFAESRESNLIAKDIENYCKTRAAGKTDREILDEILQATKNYSQQSRDRVRSYQGAISSVARSVCPQFK